MAKADEKRIQRVINNLIPTTAFSGKFGPPKNLYDQMAFYNTPGVSIAVINNFEIEWAQGFGACDVRSPKKVTTDTLFQAGSISKAIFALGVMRLVQDGRLSLDEDIHTYLSSWRVPVNGGWQPKISLRQILSHTAGLTVHGFPGYQASQALPTVPQILNGELPANTPKVEVNILPGTQFRYSGGGTTVAQQLVVDLLNKPFSKIMNELILDGLGLKNSTFAQPLPKSWHPRAATAHPWKGIPLKGRFHTYPESAAAGLWTTAEDLASVCIELLSVLNGRVSPTILSADLIESMFVPQLPDQSMSGGDYVGLGFFCYGKGDSFNFGHSGRDEGFIADMRMYKNLGKGVVIMINSNEGSPMIAEIMRAVAHEYEWPDFFPSKKVSLQLTDIQRYAGIYQSKSGMQFHVNVRGDHLTLIYAAQPPLQIYPLSDSEFFTPVLNLTLRFEIDESQRADKLVLKQNGVEFSAERVLV